MCGRIQENYQYDRTGRLTAAISGGMRYDYRYDRKNQLLIKVLIVYYQVRVKLEHLEIY